MTRPFPRNLSAGAALLLWSVGCDRQDLYGDATFTDNVKSAYAECSPGEIRFLSAKHGLQLAFDACGSNKFANFAWSPNGIDLYFQLTHGGHVMDAEMKTILGVPTETPVADAAWLRDGVLVVPLPPEGSLDTKVTSRETASKAARSSAEKYRLGIYDRGDRTLRLVELPVREPQDLQMVDGRLLLTGLGDTGTRHPFWVNTDTGAAERALPWMTQPAESLVVAGDLVGWSDLEDGGLFTRDGLSVRELPGVRRVIPHPGGRYVALEVDGESISLFDQRSWNELSEESREREQRRKQKWLEGMPEWMPREMQPPELQLLDLTEGGHFRVTSFYGEHFAWYTAQDYWCSFILWGLEGKQLHRNIALTDLAERLRMLAAGDHTLGMERLEQNETKPDEPAQMHP